MRRIMENRNVEVSQASFDAPSIDLLYFAIPHLLSETKSDKGSNNARWCGVNTALI